MSNAYYRLFYHFVWATKNRKPIITPQIECILKEFMPGKIGELGGKQLELNMTDDHLHLMASIPPRISCAEFVHSIKGSASNHVNVNLNERLFYWQSGYGVLSLSEKDVPFVGKYIENQKERHATNKSLEIYEYIP